MQKFHKYDLVRIAEDLGPCMSHFTSDCDAIVIGSYADQFGLGTSDSYSRRIKSYTLFIKGEGESSWYEEHQLTLIESDREDLLEEWKREIEDTKKLKGNIDWIFENGKSVLAHPHGASIQTLAECCGLYNLWGSRGEGITYFTNCTNIMLLAAPFLMSGDKEGWLVFSKSPVDKEKQTCI